MKLALSGLLVLIPFAAGCSSSTRHAREPRPDEPTLRLATYNVNYGLAGDEATLEAVAALDADVILLQETTDAWEVQLRGALSDEFPHMLFRHSSGAGGLAVLSRVPVREEDYVPAPSGWFPAWRLVAATPLGAVQLLAVHLHPPVSENGSVVSGYFSTPGVRENEMEEFFVALDPELPTVIAGDFNEGGSGRAIRFLEERGYRSALPEFHGRVDTWRWNTSVGTVSTQLDHVVYGPGLEPLDAQVIHRGRSDHLPVLVVLARRQR